MRILFIAVFALCSCNLIAQGALQKLKGMAKKAEKIIAPNSLSQEDITIGLKEALIVGTKNSILQASSKGGFNTNNLVKIPFPQDASGMKKTLIKVGMKSQVDEFVYALNHAAEEASGYAQDIFINVIQRMNIKDALGILNGDLNAATNYLENQARKDLYLKFKPIVITSIEKVNLAKYWSVLAQTYNSIPLTKQIEPDLEEYVTNYAIDGLFALIEKEEEYIRNDPKARVSEILEKVFK